MRYETLDLRITQQAPGRLEVWADWAHGHGSDHVALDMSDLAPELEAAARGRVSRDRLKALGTLMFERLFRSEDGDVGEQLNQCWGAAKKDRLRGIRIRLRFDNPAVGAIPWEFLFWPTRDTFLATSRQTALERYLEVPDLIRQLQVAPPIRVLVVSPTVGDLDTETEIDNLLGVLDRLNDVHYELLDGTITPSRLRATLGEHDFHLLHFIGHGGVDEKGPFLVTGDADEDAALDDEQLAGILSEHPALQLVVLNSCQGAVGSPSGPFVGMAQRLVSRGLPAVLAMQYQIFDRVAQRFSHEFYRSLLTGRSRGDIEIATATARNALATDFPNTVAFATPVLFLRTEDGVLFDLVTGSLVRDVPLGVGQAHALKSVERTVEQNLKLRSEQSATDPSPELAQQINEDREALTRIRRRLRTGAVLGVLPVVVAAVVFVMSWLYVLDHFTRWARLETLTVRLAELFDSTPLDPALALVVIDEEDLRREGVDQFDSSWRPRLGELVDRISQAGARVIALDMTFNADTESDSVLARALSDARARGISVIVAADSMNAGELQVAREVRPLVRPAIACATSGARQIADLMVRKADGGAEVLSFPLQAVLEYRGVQLTDVDLDQRRLVFDGPDGRETYTFAGVERIRRAQQACPILQPHDTVARLVMDYTDSGALTHSSRRFSFTEIVRTTSAPTQLADKLVVVGAATSDVVVPLYPGLGGERRYGFEILTDAINTMLSRAEIRPLGSVALFLLIMTTAGAGAIVAIMPRGLGLWQRVTVLAALLFTLVLGAVQAYRAAGVMIMVAYPSLALLLGFWGARTLRRWRLS